jgi:large subunit ribosomal protein L10
MPVTKAKKAEILSELNEKFKKAKAVYFSKNKGLPVKKITDLRKKLHKEGIELAVAKKTLIRLAIKTNNLPELPDEVLDGAVSAAFGYDDVVAPARLLYEFSKDNENLELLGALVEGRMILQAEAKQLATLPPREQLLGKLVGSMKSPLYGLHGTLSGVLRKFVYGLKAVHDKKAASGS